jgi:hypothetical protein
VPGKKEKNPAEPSVVVVSVWLQEGKGLGLHCAKHIDTIPERSRAPLADQLRFSPQPGNWFMKTTLLPV